MACTKLKTLVYYDGVFGNRFVKLPGIDLEELLDGNSAQANNRLLRSRLSATCRKLIMMWIAGDRALEAESEFYSTTLQDSPGLFGEEEVSLHYHLEAMVHFARSALDIGSRVFGELLPAPFRRKQYDSFNDLVKAITSSTDRLAIAATFEGFRDDPRSWLSFVADIQKGRSLRDKLVHQIGFPIKYVEFRPTSEKEYAVVYLGNNVCVPLSEFVNTLREGVISGFIILEQSCVAPSTKDT